MVEAVQFFDQQCDVFWCFDDVVPVAFQFRKAVGDLHCKGRDADTAGYQADDFGHFPDDTIE